MSVAVITRVKRKSNQRRKPTVVSAPRLRLPRPVNNGQRLKNDYIATLTDPWEHEGVYLGYDTFIPTLLASAYRRGNFTVNADGTFAMYMVPSATGMVNINTSGAAGTTWSAANATNLAAITAQGQESRVVSGGLRVMCLFPETSAPGVLFAGVDVASSGTQLVTYTPNILANASNATLGLGSKGARGIILPLDPDSYTFFVNPIVGYSASNIPNSSVITMTGFGFPAGTLVWYESILNLELLPGNGSATIGIDASTDTLPLSLCSFFPSPSALFQQIRSAIGPSTVMDGVDNLLSAANAAGYQAAGRARTALRATRSLFGTGGALNAAMVSGRMATAQGRQASLVIEEMKDDGVIVRPTRGQVWG